MPTQNQQERKQQEKQQQKPPPHSMSLKSSKNTSKSAEALRQVLQNHTAAEIPTSSTVIEIDSTMSPMEASQILWDNNILGAPVWDSTKQKYLGFFDMRDTLSAVIASHKDVYSPGNESLTLMTKWFEDMNITVSYLAARNPFVYCKPNTSLEQVCKLLAQPKCHRVPILGENGRCVGIISQSALVKTLVQHVNNEVLDQETLEQAQLNYKKDIISAKDTASAKDVFELLDSHRLSGIAVVDEESDKLVGNTSARDIKLAVKNPKDMDMDILSYLARVRQSTFSKKERYPSAHVSENSTVGHAIRLLAKTGYHRVFVVDEDVRPVGVVSVADIISFVVE